MPEKMLGKFIVFEGVEGAGKTTQIELARSFLLNSIPKLSSSQGEGLGVTVTREPGGTELGLGLRRLLLEYTSDEDICDRAELLLYSADRAQHIERFLKPELAKGSLILCDRFTDSTIAYQGYGRGLNLELINQLNNIATAGLQSDLTFWLDIDVEIGLQRAQQRGKRDRMEKANIEFHRRVQQGFQELAQIDRDRIIRIDASRVEKEVAQEIQAILTRKLKEWGFSDH
jgi:dTMP kinase